MEKSYCRECNSEVRSEDKFCSNCGAHIPMQKKYTRGYYYKSKLRVLGLPLLCISFSFKNRKPVPAIGIISIGQFGAGLFNISQFGIGIFSLSQFTIAPFAIAQFALAYKCIAQIGYAFSQSYGQSITYLGN